MKKSFPKAQLSSSDVSLALHFVQFILKEKPEDRPSALRAKHHLLMKTISNPFKTDSLHVPELNPFKMDENRQEECSHGDDTSSKMATENCLAKPTKNKGIFLYL